MRFQTAAIMGAGAVGSYIYWGLEEKLGDDLWVIGQGERAERLRREGLIINGQQYKPCVRTPREAHGVDLLIVSLKYTGLNEDSLREIGEIVDDHTTIISVMNGINSEEIIGGYVGYDHMLYSIIKISAQRTSNQVTFPLPSERMGIFYGEKEHKDGYTERELALREFFKGTRLISHLSDHILVDIWSKFSLNISNNLPQAIVGCGAGAYLDSPYLADVADHLRQEVAAVAAARGIHLDPSYGKTVKGDKVLKVARYSTLQDLDHGRRTEIEAFSGTLIREGIKLGVPTPFNQVIYDLIKTIEEKQAGKFDYDPDEMF